MSQPSASEGRNSFGDSSELYPCSSSCGLEGFAALQGHLGFGRVERNGDPNFLKAARYSLGSAEHLTVGTEVGFQSSVSGGVNAV